MHTFLHGIKTREAGVERDMTGDDLAMVLCLRDLDEGEELPEAVAQVLDAIEDQMQRYVDAGGSATSLDWQRMHPIEQGLFAEVVLRKANRERSLLAYQFAQALGSPLAHEGLTDDDETFAKTKLQRRTVARAIHWAKEAMQESEANAHG